MTSGSTQVDPDLSLFEIGAILLRGRRRIAFWTVVGALVALSLVITRPPLYRATVSFAPQGNGASEAGLAGIASQFGVSLSAGNQTLSPEYYAKLLKSNELLSGIAADSFAVPELGKRKVAFGDLVELKSSNPLERRDKSVLQLSQMVSTSVSKATGIIDVTVDTKWRSVSMAIAQALIDGVNDFNQRTRQGQAGAERRFIEGQLALATTDLRTAEDRLEQFLHGNKQYTSSPELSLQRNRLQSEVDQRRQVFNSLTQSYQEVRLREVRDTPVITVVETPFAPGTPEPRGRSKVILLGIMLGGFIGVALVLFSNMIARRRAAHDPAAVDFLQQMAALRGDIGAPWRWITRRGPS